MSENYHAKIRDALIAELEKVDATAANTAKQVVSMWGPLPDSRKREWLRLMVRSIREARATAETYQTKRVATMLNLGMDGLEAIFRMSKEDAFEKAKEAITGMAIAKSAMETLVSMGIEKHMAGALEQAPPESRAQAKEEFEAFRGAHQKLWDHLQDEVVAGTSVLPLLLARAGGREATEEDRAQWRAAFDAIEKLKANEPN